MDSTRWAAEQLAGSLESALSEAPEERPIHDQVVALLECGQRPPAALLQAQSAQIEAMLSRLELAVASDDTAPAIAEAARAALEALDDYHEALLQAAGSGGLAALEEAHSRLVAAQQRLLEVCAEAEKLLAIPMDPAPANLVILQNLLLGWMQGQASVDAVVGVIEELRGRFAQSRQGLPSGSGCNEVISLLESAYVLGEEALGGLCTVLETREEQGFPEVWKALVDSFALIQQAYRGMGGAEDEVCDFLDPDWLQKRHQQLEEG